MRAQGEAEIGGIHYRHWLAALEKLVAAKGLASVAELAVCHDRWAETHRGFGKPIVLAPAKPRDYLNLRVTGASLPFEIPLA